MRAINSGRRPTVFLCYSRTDRGAADDVLAAVQQYADCWRDTEEILSGTPWEPETLAAVTKQDVVLFLASPRSIDPEKYCVRELRTADEHGKRVACLAIEPVGKKTLPPELAFLKSRQWTSRSDPDWKQRLRADIEEDFDWVRRHTSVARAHLDYEDEHVKGRLLTGRQLKQAREMLAVERTSPPVLTPQQREYITRSGRAAVTRRWILAAVVMLLLAGATLTGMRLLDDKRRNDANNLAGAACEALGQNLGNALIMAAAAARSAETPQTRACLLSAVQAQPQVAALLPALNGASTLAVDSVGRQLAVGGQTDDGGREVMIWDLPSRTVALPPTAVAAPSRNVAAVAFSPDGAKLAVADSGSTIHVLDLTVRPPRELGTAHVGGRTAVMQMAPSVAYTPQGDLIAVGLDVTSGFVDVYVAGNLNQRHTLTANGVYGVAAAGSRIMLSASNGLFLLTRADLLATRDLRGRRPTLPSSAPTRGAALSPDGDRVAYADDSGAVHIYEVHTGKAKTFQGPAAERLAFSRDGRRLAIGTLSQSVQIRDPATGRQIQPDLRQPGGRSLIFVDDNLLAGGGDDVVLWQLNRTNRLLTAVPLPDAHPDGRRTLALDGDRALYSTTDGVLVLADGQGREAGRLIQPPNLTGVALLDREHVLMIQNTMASVWTVADNNVRSGLLDAGAVSCDGSESPQASIMAVAVVDPSHVIAAYGTCGLVMRWDLAGGGGEKLPWPMGLNVETLAAAGPDGPVAVGDFGVRDTVGEVFVIRPSDDQPLVLAVQRPAALAFDSDGSRLAVGGSVGDSQTIISVSDLDHPRETVTQPMSHGTVSAVAISPDDGVLAAGSDDGAVKLWTMTGSRLDALGSLSTGTEPVQRLAFADDGTTLRVLTPTRLLSLPLRSATWITEACAVVAPLLGTEPTAASAQRRELRQAHRDVCH